MADSPEYVAYRFGSFVLDVRSGRLLAADGEELPLRPKSFALLRLLVENAGRLLSKEEIMDVLWANVFVTENSVAQCVHDIRHALGFEAQRKLRTYPRRGYLFAADIFAVAAPDRLPDCNHNTGSAFHGCISTGAALRLG
jgi:DNA-binding winged helix-turn-helix (wHTH) protein